MLRSQGWGLLLLSMHILITVVLKSENFLKTLFIVSDVSIMDEGSLGTDSPQWVHLKTIQIPSK